MNALDNVSESSLKSRRQVEMGKFLGMPFTSCEIIDLESARVNTDGSPSPVITAYAKHGKTNFLSKIFEFPPEIANIYSSK